MEMLREVGPTENVPQAGRLSEENALVRIIDE
jgi:hypothetical protein